MNINKLLTASDFMKENANPKTMKVAGAIPLHILLTLPKEDQELFLSDPLKFFKKYKRFAK